MQRIKKRKVKDELKAARQRQEWYEANKEEVLAKRRAYYLKNRERIIERQRQYREENQAFYSARAAERYRTDPEHRERVKFFSKRAAERRRKKGDS